MATKYAGQNALNKLMQIVKTALASKADKTNATTSAAGLMSAADKTKLDGIAAGATKVTVDGDLSGTSTNPVQNKVIKSALDGKASTALATITLDGLMSKSDKEKLNGIAAGATKVTVDGNMSKDSVNPVQNKTVKAYVDNATSGMKSLLKAYTDTSIASAIAGVYTPKGSIAFASLPTAAAGNEGWVYNVTDAFTTTAAFVEGAGHAYSAGTNVVCVDAGSGSYKWDVLAGTIDLTELTADEVQTLWDSI